MDYLLIALVSLVASGLTLYSGFGLGTLLMPIFAIFFPVDIAVTLTAIVHFLNNIFKLILTVKNANWKIILAFGIPAVVAAFAGAQLLVILSDLEPVYRYTIGSKLHEITIIKIIISVLMLIFAIYELIPSLSNFKVKDKKYLYIGGALSGFFGGLSGHQGAFRSAFLVHTGITKEAFIATGVVIACFVDITRISVYGIFLNEHLEVAGYSLLITAIISAFLGAFIGNKLVKKITMRTIQIIVGVLLILIAVLIGTGLI